jgi:anaerobic selenocysteine-containing dehydrogenase
MSVAPDSGAVRRGMSRDDLFLCVHEQFMTETAAMADIVLPATTFLEHDDIYVSSGHTFVQLARAVIDAPGECRSNHEVICALAARLGASHRGFSMSAWEIIDETLRRSGLPDAETLAERHWHDVSRGFDEMHFLNGFGHDDGRFHFRADWSRGLHYRSDMPALPDHYAVIDADSERCPFRLVTAPARWFLNSSFSETANSRRRQGRPTAKLHPDDCAALGVAAGDAVRIGNDRGSLLVAAEPFAGVHRGTVIVESIWPARCFAEGRGVNTLTSADPGLPDGGAVFHDTAVWVRGEPWPAVADSDSVPA